MRTRNRTYAPNSCAYEVYRLSACRRSEIWSEKTLEIGGQALHAGLIGFEHPKTGEYIERFAPLPAEFEAVIEQVRKEDI